MDLTSLFTQGFLWIYWCPFHLYHSYSTFCSGVARLVFSKTCSKRLVLTNFALKV